MPTQCLISFGSNLGDRNEVVARAARLVDHSGLVLPSDSDKRAADCPVPAGLRTSRLFETPPIGGPSGQSPFLNAVAAFATEASAADVLDVLQKAELQLGRERHNRWGARSIDLDVVLHGRLLDSQNVAGRRGFIGGRGPAGSSNALVVPHPRYTARKFVVAPACDVAGDFCDPRFGWSLSDLLVHIEAAPPSMALEGGDAEIRRVICQRLRDEHGVQIYDPNTDVDSFDDSLAWVSSSVPLCLQNADTSALPDRPMLPRLIARIQKTTPSTRWPAPHQMWPSGWNWPEYRLEVDDLDWAIGEMASALDSMRCHVAPITNDGDWW